MTETKTLAIQKALKARKDYGPNALTDIALAHAVEAAWDRKCPFYEKQAFAEGVNFAMNTRPEPKLEWDGNSLFLNGKSISTVIFWKVSHMWRAWSDVSADGEGEHIGWFKTEKQARDVLETAAKNWLGGEQ